MKPGFLFTTLLALVFGPAATSGVADDATTRRFQHEDGYPTAQSKKGLQVELIGDALHLGVKHAAINVNLSQLVAPGSEGVEGVLLHRGDGERRFYFHLDYVAGLDRQIKALSDHGVVVHLIVLAYASGREQIDQLLLHPAYDLGAPNRLGAFNVETQRGRAWLYAALEFMAGRWSRPDRQFGRVAGYIVGNEVNSHWWWYNRGDASMKEVADDYLGAVRLMYQAVHSQSPWARVYVSLDHHWGIRYPAGTDRQTFPGKAFIDYFATQARRDGADFPWHVALHPYPENLFDPRFWQDKTATTAADTARITFKNLEVLVDYLRRPELTFRGRPRRIILSEQGFHTPDGPDGETLQAAAYCYAYRKVAQLDGIDAFILHRHVDHPHEGGLRLGLRRFEPGARDPRPPKKIYECFRQADTDDWQAAFEFALPVVGLERW